MGGGGEKVKFCTVEEYLERERLADERSEYYDGQIIPIAYSCVMHSLIAANVCATFGNALDHSRCQVYECQLRVQSAPSQIVYPDMTVICGKVALRQGAPDVVTNPRLIVEVISPLTAYHDSHIKWLRYQQLVSLTDYLLVWQEQPVVEHFSRDEAGRWYYEAHEGLDAVLSITSLNCSIPLPQIYAGVDFVAG